MQLIEEAIDYPNPYDNSTACLIPVFDPMMTVLREQWSYPIISLVADTGGILGLFIGFNFLMVWDWTVGAVKTVWRKNTTFWNIFTTNK